MAYVGLLPFVDHGLPDEDGAAVPPARPGFPRVAVTRYPMASNLDELKPLEQVAELVWAYRSEHLAHADLVVLPGSKHVSADLAWLRQQGLADAVAEAARRGTRVLGICGGLQMLGREIVDSGEVDGDAVGLGLLPVRTTFRRAKRTESVEITFPRLPEPWDVLSGTTVRGYEIRHGDTVATGPGSVALPGGRGFVQGPVLGVSVHGSFEQPELVEQLFGRRPQRGLDVVFEDLATLVEERLDMDELVRLAGLG